MGAPGRGQGAGAPWPVFLVRVRASLGLLFLTSGFLNIQVSAHAAVGTTFLVSC